MKLFHHHGLDDIRGEEQTRCFAIGVFDGVHVGHRLILERLRAFAEPLGAITAIWTFGENIPKPNFERLMPEEQWLRSLAAVGLQEVHRMDFVKEVTELSAEAFLQQVLYERLGCRVLVLGADARLGKDRACDAWQARDLAKAFGLRVEVLEMEQVHGDDQSSTRMRDWIRAGDFEAYEGACGRPYGIGSWVVKDQGLGSQLGFPTANLDVEGVLTPPHGVYAVEVSVQGELKKGVANVGIRPTVSSEARKVLEVHIKDFSGDLYGQYLELSRFKFLRSEQKFASIEALKEQLARDVASV